MLLVQNIFPKNVVNVYHHCLTFMYFSWNGEFYEQIDVVVMGTYLEFYNKMDTKSKKLREHCNPDER